MGVLVLGLGMVAGVFCGRLTLRRWRVSELPKPIKVQELPKPNSLYVKPSRLADIFIWGSCIPVYMLLLVVVADKAWW